MPLNDANRLQEFNGPAGTPRRFEVGQGGMSASRPDPRSALAVRRTR